MLGKLLKKAKRKAGNSAIGKMADANEMEIIEASMAAVVLVAYASGDANDETPGNLSDEEVDAVVANVQSDEMLEMYGDEPLVIFDSYCDLMDANPRKAKSDLMKKIELLEDNESSAEKVMFMAIATAEATGGIDRDEMSILKLLATTMGVRLSSIIDTRSTDNPGRASSRS